MPEHKPIKILKASAGSGKTFRLVRFYLKLCFEHRDDLFYFKHILAITFTNKATNEMRERILDEVKLIAREPEESDHFTYLQNELDIQSDSLRSFAEALMKVMIHNYEQISVSTIDSFFQRVLRSFARDLGLDTSFQVQLDTEEVIQQAVEKLVRKIDSNHHLYEWLSDELKRKIDEGKTFQLKETLISLASQIYTEEIDLDRMENLDFKVLKKLYWSLRGELKALEKANKEYIKTAEKLMDDYGFVIDDFSYASSSFMSALTNKVELADLEDVLTSSRLQDVREDPHKMYSNKNSDRTEEYLRFYDEALQDHIEEYLEFAREAYHEFRTADLLLSDLIPYITLHALSPYLNEVKRENNWMVLAETNRFLRDLMDSMFVPFMYEKIAVEYHHLLIDEFQDTSAFQWLNLSTLIEENSSKGHENLIVGDVKQAIYRFRNGKWGLLQSEVEEQYGNLIETEFLKQNFRSDENIIEFNNRLFGSEKLPDLMKRSLDRIVEKYHHSDSGLSQIDTSEVTDIYENNEQQLPEVAGMRDKVKGKGYVEVNFLDKKVKNRETDEVEIEKEDLYLRKLYRIFKTLKSNGYRPRDIAILCERKKQIKQVVEIIEKFKQDEEQFPGFGDDFLEYINNEALLLSNDRIVRYVLANFRMMKEPDLELHHIELLNLTEENLNFIADEEEVEQRISVWKKRHAEIEGTSLVEIAEMLLNYIPESELEKHSIYIQSFLEELLQYQTEHGSYMSEFLEWWDDEEVKLTLPEDIDAMQIMTVHKSKGLAFPIVIMPYLDWKFKPESFHKNILWVDYEFEGQELRLPIDWTYSSLTSDFSEIVFEEVKDSHIDAINLLYVGMTRTENELYLISTTPSDRKRASKDKMNVVLQEYISENAELLKEEESEEGIHTFSYGNQAGRVRDKVESDEVLYELGATHYRTELPELRTISWEEDTLSAETETKERVLQGNAIHTILENTKYVDDLDQALQTSMLNGVFPEEEMEKWRSHLQKLFSQYEIRELFSRDYDVLVEREIITETGKVLIPDRVVINENEVHIIDFKSGDPHDYYRRQLKRYKEQFEKMGYENIKTSILYTHHFNLERLD